jgi:hypothetical protein
MAHITCQVITSLPKEAFIAALTDFTPARLQVWPNIAPKYYKVHGVAKTSADVTEGSTFAGGVWERVTYDWSQPDMVTVTVKESNTFAPGSFWKYTLHTEGNYTTIALEVCRRIHTFKSLLLSLPLALFGNKIFRQDLQRTINYLEAHAR